MVIFSQGKYFGGDGSGYASSTIVLETLSVPTLTFKKIMLYPNPATSIIYLSKQTDKDITIIDVNGKLILKFKPKQNKINVSQLSQGIYFLKYKNKAYRFIKK